MALTNNKKMVLCALFIAVSFVLANVKVMNTIAFDSMPAFLGALILGNFYGAVIGAIGHLLTALLSGFPMGLPVHLIIAAVMAVTVIFYGYTYQFLKEKFNVVIASIGGAFVATLINGPGAVLALRPLLLPVMGQAALNATMVVLTVVSFINVLVALIIYPILEKAKIL